MIRPFRAASVGVIGVLGACAAGWAGHACLGESTCATISALGVRAAASGVVVAGLVTLALVVVRAAWLLGAASRAVSGLPHRVLPGALGAAMRRAGLRANVSCVRDDGALAFCAGAVRPRIVVTDTLVDSLRPHELDAVLAHEAAHAGRRDPLRHALRRAAAEVLFYLPVVAWWARRQLAEAELSADRVAIARVGAESLAGALWVVGGDVGTGVAPDHHAPAGLRVRQVLGDRTPRLLPTAADLAASVAGLGVAVTAGLCLSQLLGS